MVQLWKTFCRSILEQSCVLWDGGLTAENRRDLERTQKTFARLVLEEDFKNYKQALSLLQIPTLQDRRKELTLRFAETGIMDGTLTDLFPKIRKRHTMETRKENVYKVTHANTSRLKNSPVITMQRMLNEEHKNQNK